MPLQLHHAIGWLLVLVELGLVAFRLPVSVFDEAGQPAIGGPSYLIFFIHYPSALNCLNFFVIAGIVGFFFLGRHDEKAVRLDRAATTAVEVGVVACTVTLVTGSIWAKAAWNMYWDFGDKRLMTVAIMWFMYVGFLAFRGSIADPTKRARFSAIFVVIASINVPLVYFSIKLFGRSSHPEPDPNLLADFDMKLTRWFGALAFLIVYTAIWRHRYRLAAQRDEAARLEQRFADAGI